MKIIKLTAMDSDIIRINAELIGHYYKDTETKNGKTITCTKVGVMTHNNGGFRVMETPQEIDKLIED